MQIGIVYDLQGPPFISGGLYFSIRVSEAIIKTGLFKNFWAEEDIL